jgi:hypothetical protein
MKTIGTMLMVLLLSVQVRAEQPDPPFRTNDLPNLNLSNLGDFWKDDTPAKREDASKSNFQREGAYLGGIRYRGKNKKVEIAVFKSQGESIKAMEALRADVASVIKPGDTNSFVELKWWFTSGIPNSVFVVCRNTVVTVACYQPAYAESKSMLQETAAIIVDRIKKTMKTSNRVPEDTARKLADPQH